MSKVKQADIDQLIVLVGGRENIATVSHCITRLRFVLNDPAKANPKAIEELSMVKGCFTNAGQFQVVIGTEVARAVDFPLRGDLLPAAAGADQRRPDFRLP